MAMSETELHKLIKKFDTDARPKQTDPNAPATVKELNNLVTQISSTLDKLVSELARK